MNNKLVINTNLLRKESEFKTYTCVVEKAVPVSTEEFERLKHAPMCNNDLISENLNSMWYGNGVHHCLLIYDDKNGDGLVIESEGSKFARYAQYIPKARELVERHQNPEIQLTNGERKLHELLNETAERIAIFAKLGYSEFSLYDVLDDLGCDFDEVKKMLVEAAAEILNERKNIQSVKIHDLDVPFQPDILVEIKEENSECEDMSEEPDMGMTM